MNETEKFPLERFHSQKNKPELVLKLEKALDKLEESIERTRMSSEVGIERRKWMLNFKSQIDIISARIGLIQLKGLLSEGQGNELNRRTLLLSYSINLNHEPDSEEKKELISRLRAIGKDVVDAVMGKIKKEE